MKKIILKLVVLSAVFVLVFSCKNQPKVAEKTEGKVVESLPTLAPKAVQQKSLFEGNWSWDKNDARNTFSIEIVEKNDSLHGSYCAVARGGNKIDCNAAGEAMEEDPSFSVLMPKNDNFEFDFIGYFSGEKGRAKLSVKDGKLTWKMIKNPGECYAPEDAVLVPSLKGK